MNSHDTKNVSVDWGRVDAAMPKLAEATKRPDFRQCPLCGLAFPTPNVDSFTSKDWLCPACDEKTKEARITCKKCGSLCGLFPPGVTELGYRVFDRDELHVNHCPNCPRPPEAAKPGEKVWDGKVPKSVILEFAEYESRLRGVPLERIVQDGMA